MLFFDLNYSENILNRQYFLKHQHYLYLSHMNILPGQIYQDQNYKQMAQLFKGKVQNNCLASYLFDAYHQILTDLYQFRDFIEKASQYYLYDEVRSQIRDFQNLQKGIEWNKVYSIKYGLIYDGIYKFWKKVKSTVERIYQQRRQQQRKQIEQKQRQQLQRVQQAMNRLSLSNWKCYNNHKCILTQGKGTNRCNICREKLEQKLLLRCNACDFDICQNCADNQDPSIVKKFYPSNTNTTKTNTIVNPIKPKQQKIQVPPSVNRWFCLKNHQLRQNTAHSQNVCNICWEKIGYKPQVRCQQCDFDVCNDCWTTKSPKLVKMYDNYFEPSQCEKGHKMRPIHTIKAHSCDICRKDLISQAFITCIRCNFDVCYTCNQQQQSDQEEQEEPVYHQSQRNKVKPKLCSKGHQAILYPFGGAYHNGEYICSHCQKDKGRVKTYHCPKCQWDLCNECIIRLGYQ